MISIILRILFPFALAYLAVRALRSFWNTHVSGSMTTATRPKENIIDICPRCGEIVTRQHRCLS